MTAMTAAGAPTSGTAGRKVGDLAAATGLTVRTLHYYEEVGLLVASARSESGHRLYGAADVERLYQICLLRRLGLPLGEIGRALDDPATIDYEPVDQPYGYREYSARDSEGGLWSFMKPLD